MNSLLLLYAVFWPSNLIIKMSLCKSCLFTFVFLYLLMLCIT